MAERLVPGLGYVSESRQAQTLVPGVGYFDDPGANATHVLLVGPSSGLVGTASDPFTVSLNGLPSGSVTVTPSDGNGGSFNPASVVLTEGASSATFTYTPTSKGEKLVTVTNSGSLTNPSGATYTAIAVPTGAVTEQPPTDGQNQRFVGTTTDADTGSYTLTGSNGGVTVSGQFTITQDSFDFTVTGLAPGNYAPTLTVSGTGGTVGVTGTSAFSIAGVGGGPELPRAPVVIVNLTGFNFEPLSDMTGLSWAWFDSATPDTFVAPVDKGSGAITDAEGVFSATLSNSSLNTGQTGWLIITDSDGNPAMLHKAFSGPVTVQ